MWDGQDYVDQTRGVLTRTSAVNPGNSWGIQLLPLLILISVGVRVFCVWHGGGPGDAPVRFFTGFPDEGLTGSDACVGCAGMARMVANAAAIWLAQGQWVGIRSRRCRPPWLSRAGTCSTRNSGLGFSSGEVAVEGDQLQPGRQVGGDRRDLDPDLVIVICRDGNRPRPVSLATRMRSSTRAWARCPASRKPSWPPSCGARNDRRSCGARQWPTVHRVSGLVDLWDVAAQLFASVSGADTSFTSQPARC